MKKELKTRKLGLKKLTSLKERKLNIIRMQELEKRDKIRAFERRKINNWLEQNERSFYKHLRNFTANEIDLDKVEFKNKTVNQGFDSLNVPRDDYENFWGPTWQEMTIENLEVKWIQEVRVALDHSIPDN